MDEAVSAPGFQAVQFQTAMGSAGSHDDGAQGYLEWRMCRTLLVPLHWWLKIMRQRPETMRSEGCEKVLCDGTIKAWPAGCDCSRLLLLGPKQGRKNKVVTLTLKARYRVLASSTLSSAPTAQAATPAFGSDYTCTRM